MTVDNSDNIGFKKNITYGVQYNVWMVRLGS